MKERDNIQLLLQKQLEVFKVKLGLGDNLEVLWKHDLSKSVSGEVKNKTIYIYESDREKAVETLLHEVLDYCWTSKIIVPLVSLLNLLIKFIADEVYRDKEKLIESICRLLKEYMI